MPYIVHLVDVASQAVDVSDDNADSIDAAIEWAEANNDLGTNISNHFDMAGEPRAVAVTDADGNEVWNADGFEGGA